MFILERVLAKDDAKSSGKAVIANDDESVAAESAITVFLLFSMLSRESFTKFVSGTHEERKKNDIAAARSRDRIWVASLACFVDNISSPP